MALGSATVGNIRGMTLVQRHAELVFAECTLLKVRPLLFSFERLMTGLTSIMKGGSRYHLLWRFHRFSQRSY